MRFYKGAPWTKIFICIALCLISSTQLFAAVLQDDVGRRVELKTPVSSIVCLSPAHTEMIYWLGCGDKLKAVSENCNYPEQAKNLPKAGNFMYPDIEAIVKIKPEAVISGGGIQKKAIQSLESLGIRVIVLYPRSINGIIKDMEILSGILGCKNNEEKIKQFKNSLGAAPAGKKVKVYAELWGNPAMGIGGNSFLNEVIERAGGENILKDAVSEFPKVSIEEIIKRQPDVIILLYEPESGFMDRQYIKMTPAGKTGRVYSITKTDLDCALRPGPRIGRAIEVFRGLIGKGGAR
jgi:iron complex transport system substrate-binding protein